MNRSTRERPPLGGSGTAPYGMCEGSTRTAPSRPSRGHGLESLLWQIIPASGLCPPYERPYHSVRTEFMHSQVWILVPRQSE